MTQDQANEIQRISANLVNYKTTINGMSNYVSKLGLKEWLIALSDAKGSTYPNHCASSNAPKLILSCGLILNCANLGNEPGHPDEKPNHNNEHP